METILLRLLYLFNTIYYNNLGRYFSRNFNKYLPEVTIF